MRQLAKLVVLGFVPATFLVAGVVLVELGLGERGIREALRATARVSLVLFCLVFVARPLHELVRGRASAWLLAERRTLGVCFGLGFSAHLLLVASLFVRGRSLSLPDGVTVLDVVIGGPGLVLIALMTATSAHRVRAAMSRRAWHSLHRVGLYFVWFVFVACLLNSIGEKADRYPAWHYVPFLALLAAALGVRMAAALRRRSVGPPPSPEASARDATVARP